MQSRTRIVLAALAMAWLCWCRDSCVAATPAPEIAVGLAAMQRGDFVQAVETLQQVEQHLQYRTHL